MLLYCGRSLFSKYILTHYRNASFLSCFARDRTWVSVPPIFNLLTNIKTVKDTLLTSIRSCPSICWGECVRPRRLVSEKGLPSSDTIYHKLEERKLDICR